MTVIIIKLNQAIQFTASLFRLGRRCRRQAKIMAQLKQNRLQMRGFAALP